MASRTLAMVLSETRVQAGDTNTTNPGIDSPTIRSLIMEWAQFFQAGFGVDVTPGTGIVLAPGALAGGGNITPAFDAPLQVYRVMSDLVAGEMEIKSVAEILSLQRSAPAQGVVKKVAVEILGGTTRLVTLYPHPIPSASTTFSVYYRAQLTELATDGSADASLILLPLFETRAIGRLVGADVARLLGRDEAYINGILRPLPDYMKLAANLRDTRLRPRNEPEKIAP